MKGPLLHVFSLFSLLLILSALPVRAEVTVEASLNRDSFPVDRTAQLVITASGTRSASIEMKEVDGLRFHSRGQSSRVNIINGDFSSSISNSYLVEALQPGKYTIPPLPVTAGGKTFQTKPITFEVTSAGSRQPASAVNPADPAGKNRVAFIRLTKIDKHFTGEIVPVRIKAYFNRNYRANINSLPVLKADGVIMSPIDGDPQQNIEKLQGVSYNVLSWDTTLSGIKSGNHSISFELDATLLIPGQRQSIPSFGSGFFDDSFFDNFFGGSRQKAIKVKSPEIHFEVIDLPTKGRPEDFTGAIGDFQLSVSASPKTVETGEPITLTIEIGGRGNFDRVEVPVFPKSPNWKTYTPTSDYSGQKNLITGKKQFEQAIVAKNSSINHIPSLSFSYFDPEKKHYRTISSQPIDIRISTPDTVPSPARRMQSSPAVASLSSPTPAAPSGEGGGIKGLAPLHLEMGSLHKTITPIYRKIWFLATVAGCVLSLLVIFFLKMRIRSREKHPEVQLRKKGQLLLAENLSLLEGSKAAGDGSRFLALCRQMIQQQFGLLWQQEPSAISLADISTRLGEETDLVEIFATAEQSVYGGATLSTETMQRYFDTLKKELEERI